ncbi:hypothetical protein [Streptomyces sp. NL15-2K]|uniref:hypothetical protein n=1 Tax=Streptomyces sp. NL15-2K TaxID=376149 RepID=UPI00155A344C
MFDEVPPLRDPAAPYRPLFDHPAEDRFTAAQFFAELLRHDLDEGERPHPHRRRPPTRRRLAPTRQAPSLLMRLFEYGGRRPGHADSTVLKCRGGTHAVAGAMTSPLPSSTSSNSSARRIR